MSEREKYHVLMLIYGIQRKDGVDEAICSEGVETVMEKGRVGTVGRGESGADGESGTDVCVHCRT